PGEQNPVTLTRVSDLLRDIDPGVVGVCQQQGDYHDVAFARCEHVRQSRLILLAKSNAHYEVRPHALDQHRDGARIGGRAWIGTAVGGQYQGGHDACNPHSVFDRPCQRPLRGSAPASGLAVQGAQPIDEYPSSISGLTSTSFSAMYLSTS